MRQQAAPPLQPILNAYPVQNGQDFGTPANPNLAEFIRAYSLPSAIDATSIRVDHTLTLGTSLFFRYATTPSYTDARSLSVLTQNEIDTRTYTFGATTQLSRHLGNEFRLGYANSRAFITGTVDDFGGAVPTNLAQALGGAGGSSPQEYFYVQVSGVGYGILSLSDTSNRGHQWNIVDTLSLSSGKHTVRTGVDFRRIGGITSAQSPYLYAAYLSNASLSRNSADLGEITYQLRAEPLFNQFSAFIQDEWRVRPKVGLSLGLRWEVNPPPTGANGNDAYTVLGSLSNPGSLVLAPHGTPLWKTPWYNLAPRVGVAWTAYAQPDWETVVRAGGGVFFDSSNEPAASGFDGLGFTAYSVLYDTAVPFTPAQLNFAPSTTPPYTGATIYAYPLHLQLPYTLQWNVSVEQAMRRDQALTLTYIGANGRRLIGAQSLSLTDLNPNFGAVIGYSGGITSSYQALQTQFQRAVKGGLRALASYTWAHSIDFGSNYAALPLVRGNSDFDLRDNVSGGLSWDLPTTDGGSLNQLLLNDWGLDGRLTARTGFPVTLNGNYLQDPTTGSQYLSGVDLLRGRPLYLYGPQYPGGRALNGGPGTTDAAAAFVLPTGTNSGNAPRNLVRGFGATQINLAARRNVVLRDRLALQFRAEAFNLLNHPNFGYVDPTLTDSTFGRVTKMLNNSLGTVASQYQQGGSRSMQFALRLVF